MTILPKRDSAIDIRAIHEAGHAVAAVQMRVPFSYVTVEPNVLPSSGGHLMLEFPTHRGTIRSIKRLIVVLFAGASAADYILKLDGAFYKAQIAGDMRQIKSAIIASKRLIPVKRRKAFIQECRAKAEALVRTAFAEKAINKLAKELILRKRLSANRVKTICAGARKAS